MKTQFAVLFLTLLLALPAAADDFNIGPGESLARVVALQKGKSVTLRTVSGQELTGQIKNVTEGLVQLTGLAGKEFFDAVVPLDKIEAVVIRTK